MYVLQAGQDFWDDRREEVVEAAEEEIDAALQALVAALTARWGEPEPYADGEGPASEPMNELCRLSGEMLAWRRWVAGRWVGLAVGQADREFPIVLLAAVGRGADSLNFTGGTVRLGRRAPCQGRAEAFSCGETE
ncbi:hypothetical protein GCM10010404_35250 [Nonomuraea africana]|uniref:Uncharacterized protein n=1 Tax=Nonomuraea africana TaxID=46171 RepID=A0ABR9KR50_9ACTN|nr:hypothetical protein [Nonomuraea africana]MBE1564497.1 hypothetical protein [Nonomuraea africana]